MSNQVDSEGEDQAELRLFGKRLQFAVMYSRFRRDAEFLEAMNKFRGANTKGSFYMHANGATKATPKFVAAYEKVLDLPAGWLWRKSETAEEMDAAIEAWEQRDLGNPVLRRVLDTLPGSKIANNVVELPINHASKDIGTDSSIITEIRHIPILPDDKISSWLAGERRLEMLSEKTFPLPSFLDDHDVGPRVFFYRMATNDISMVGIADRCFQAGSLLVVDPDQEIIPGHHILARLKGDTTFLVRRYQAPWPLVRAKEYSLIAVNPRFEPIRVSKPRDWEIGGRIMFSLERG